MHIEVLIFRRTHDEADHEDDHLRAPLPRLKTSDGIGFKRQPPTFAKSENTMSKFAKISSFAAAAAFVAFSAAPSVAQSKWDYAKPEYVKPSYQPSAPQPYVNTFDNKFYVDQKYVDKKYVDPKFDYKPSPRKY